MQAWAEGLRHFVSFVHALDLVVVLVSLAFEIISIAAHEAIAEIGSLLVLLRLWRIVRILHATSEISHFTHAKERIDADHVIIQELVAMVQAHQVGPCRCSFCCF